MLSFLGKLHPLIVHLPIGAILVALILAVMAQQDKLKHLKSSVSVVLWISFFSAVGACISGLFLFRNDAYPDQLATTHQWLGVGLCLTLGIGSWFYPKAQKTWTQVLIWTILFSLLGLTSHWGGSLTHGEDYLTFSKQTKELDFEAIALEEADYYTHLVQPILTQKCTKCHSQQKQKGQLNLDNPAAIRKGGENGNVIQENQADDSPLFQRIQLAISNKEHMPPKGQIQLSPREIQTLKLWINKGADMSGQPIPAPEKEALIEIWQSPDIIPLPPLLPIAEVKPAPLEIVEALQDRGITVVPVTANSSYLLVNLLEKKDLSTADWELLLGIKKQLIWLKAGGTQPDAAVIDILSQLNELRQLDLSNNELKDSDLSSLSSLNALQSLNLSFNELGMEGLKFLEEFSELRNLYLFENQIPAEDQKQLKADLPETKVEFGDYVNLLQTVSSDSLRSEN